MDQIERERIEAVMRDLLRREGLISKEHIIDHDWIRQEMASKKARQERDRRIAATLVGGIILGFLTWVGSLVIHWLRGTAPQP